MRKTVELLLVTQAYRFKHGSNGATEDIDDVNSKIAHLSKSNLTKLFAQLLDKICENKNVYDMPAFLQRMEITKQYKEMTLRKKNNKKAKIIWN